MFKYNKEISFAKNTSHGEILSLIGKGERILEFGCAKGELAGIAKEKLGCKVWGIEISEIALKEAQKNLEGAVLCDIENHEWEKDFEGMKFDTLLFADVLEHLREPASAIRRALPLLKDDGKVIFSVPNIAHADIILKLLNNHFDYSDIGLLDNTHIRFFAKENLLDFCKDADIFPTYITKTTCPVGTSEQGAGGAISPAHERIIGKMEHADAYQFVVCAVKASSAPELKTEWEFPKAPCEHSFLFFDIGNGFSAELSSSFAINGTKIDISVELPKNASRVRLDPTVNGGYIINNLDISADGVCVNGLDFINMSKIGNACFMSAYDDPQIIFDIPKGTKELCVRAELINGVDFNEVLPIVAEKADAINNELNAQAHNIASLNQNISTLTAEVAEKERCVSELNDNITRLEADRAELNQELKQQKVEAKRRISILETDLDITKKELAHYQLHYHAAINQREELTREVNLLREQYNVISNAGWWKITKPFRVIGDAFKRTRVGKFFRIWKNQGFKAAWAKVKRKRKSKKAALVPLYSPEELEAQRKFKFERDIKFSILVPLYNTPEKFLREMIDSVIAQTYSNWELCLADGSDNEHKDVQAIVQKYAKKDSRIVYKKLEKNLGISGNTNACIEMSTGDYISLFDHDDLLHPAALYNIMKAICNQDADFIYTDENTFHFTPSDAYCPHFKPDYAPDTLRTNNYICHFTSFDKRLIDEVGMFRPECDGSQDYDMVLRLTEKAKKIVHIPKILYWWRAHAGSVATDIGAKPYVIEAAHRALRDHLDRVGLKGEVVNTVVPSIYRIKYEIESEPLVSIIIANKDHSDDLRKCINSIILKSTYKNYEIIVVENNSTEDETFEYYEELKESFGIKVIVWESNGKFNYSAINNLGVKESSGDYVILLNNDTEIISPEWIEEMLMFAQRPDVGAVGAKLYYPDNTIQHAGIGIGLLTLAGHYFKGFHRNDPGYMGRLIYAHNVSAVTAACVMVPRRVWNEIDGLDETFEVAFNDVDMCMRIRQKNYLIVFTPFCELYHYESKSRGLDSAPEKRERFVGEVTRFQTRWKKELDDGDPYYNPNFTLDKEDFSLR